MEKSPVFEEDRFSEDVYKTRWKVKVWDNTDKYNTFGIRVYSHTIPDNYNIDIVTILEDESNVAICYKRILHKIGKDRDAPSWFGPHALREDIITKMLNEIVADVYYSGKLEKICEKVPDVKKRLKEEIEKYPKAWYVLTTKEDLSSKALDISKGTQFKFGK